MGANWQYKTIADVCSVLTDGNWIESKDQSPEGIRLIQTGNIGNGVFKDKGDKARYISEETFDRLGCTEIFEGDVLVSRLPEPIGRSCILPKLNQRTITAVDCSILRFKNNLLNKFFVYYTLSPAYDRTLKNYITGSSRKRISRSNLSSIKIPVPTLEEQKTIVSELDLIAGIIDKKNAQLHDLEVLAQSIFYEIFGDPISNEKGWPTKCVGEFADVTDYVANGSFATLRENVSYRSEPDYAILVRLADFSNAFDRSKFVYVDKHAYGFLAKSKLFGGEIIMSNVGSVGKSFICPDLGQPMSLAPNSIVIKTPNNIYSYACFQMPSFQLAIKGITSQTALPKFNKTEFKKIKVICPPAEMQAQYEERWKAIQRQRERMEASLRDAQALLDSRMDYYFND